MRREPRLLVPWLLLAAVCCLLMWVMPGDETIPYHVGWIGLALAFGFDPWPRAETFASVGLFTMVTGAILAQRAATGVIAWEETAEIPLMCVLVLLMIWHVRRRQAATAELAALAASEREQAARRERLSQVTSHSMRTPLTIASGYLDLLLSSEVDQTRVEDLEVVRDELSRLGRTGERFLRMMKLAPRDAAPLDVDALLAETARRWALVADRGWMVSAQGGLVDGSEEEIRLCVDTLIENAVRYTSVGGTVRLFAVRQARTVTIGVADSGSGMDEGVVESINRGEFATADTAPNGLPTPGSQNGLGLWIVHELVTARGGRVMAERAPEGGACLSIALPLAGPVRGPAQCSSPGAGAPLATAAAERTGHGPTMALELSGDGSPAGRREAQAVEQPDDREGDRSGAVHGFGGSGR